MGTHTVILSLADEGWSGGGNGESESKPTRDVEISPTSQFPWRPLGPRAEQPSSCETIWKRRAMYRWYLVEHLRLAAYVRQLQLLLESGHYWFFPSGAVVDETVTTPAAGLVGCFQAPRASEPKRALAATQPPRAPGSQSGDDNLVGGRHASAEVSRRTDDGRLSGHEHIVACPMSSVSNDENMTTKHTCTRAQLSEKSSLSAIPVGNGNPQCRCRNGE